MRPLERQAVSARSYSDVEADLRAARRALFSTRLHGFERRRATLESELVGSTSRERDLRLELVTLDAQASNAAAEMASRREEMLASTLGTLQGLAERARGTASVIQERDRSLRQALIASADENVIATLEADAAKLTTDLQSVDDENLALAVLREAVAVAQEELDAAQSDVRRDVGHGFERSRRSGAGRRATTNRAAGAFAELAARERTSRLDAAQ